MKNIILILATAVIIFNLTGCGKSEAEKKKELAMSRFNNFKPIPLPDPKQYKTPKF
jgi:hypothetical protein